MIIHENFPLEKLNTFRINVYAQYYCEVTSEEDLVKIIDFSKANKADLLVLGGGSNILFTKNFKGIIVKNQIKGITIVNQDEDYVWIESKAGEVWHILVLHTVENGWGGIENLSLIPGSVGASPIQNIGAYGVEIKDTCVEVKAIEIETQQSKSFSASQCNFGYRDSYFKNEGKGKYIVTSVTFKLSKKPVLNTSYGQISEILLERGIKSPNIKDVSDAIIHIRKSKLPDPEKIGNAGSFFKNPVVKKELFLSLRNIYPDIPSYPVDDYSVKVPAGWLIEQRGWKGKSLGNAGVHDKQSLVLVNRSQATGEEIYFLAKEIQNDVFKTFGIPIEMEVNIF